MSALVNEQSWTTADPYLDAATRAFGDRSDTDPLAALGWWDLLADLDDRDSRTAVAALFRAQGRLLGTSAAFAALLAQPFLAVTGHAPGSLVAAVPAPGRNAPVLLLGDPAGADVLVDRPGRGALVLPAGQTRLQPAAGGRLVVHEVDAAHGTDVVDETAAAPARARGLFLGRLALSLEMLGAAEGAFTLALRHARAREQFGRPIGTFQAVRHLLARAATDCTAITAAATTATDLDTAAPPRYDQVVKALTGRNARRVCEHTLQVLGAIGFTREHGHHHFHARVLALDALLGSSAELKRTLAAALRAGDSDPLASPA